MDFRERAQIDRAIATMAYATPAIAAGLVKAVLPRMEVCEKCEGLGWLYVDGRVPPELVHGYLGPVPTEPDGRAARTCPFCKGRRQGREAWRHEGRKDDSRYHRIG